MHLSHHSIQVLPDRIIKHFDDPVCCFRERDIYSLKLPVIPRLIADHSPTSLEIELIHGYPYLDAMNTFDPEKLGHCLADFHKATMIGEECHCHWDNNPKNILFCEGNYFLIDFSDSIISYPECDLTHLMLFWFEVMDDEHLIRAKSLLLRSYGEVLSINIPRWNDSIPSSYERFIARRLKWEKPISERISHIDNVIRVLKI